MGAVIELRGVGKRYRVLEEDRSTLRASLPLFGPRKRDLWALRNLDLSVAEGEIVGVLGHNGAGKTTMLRLLAGVTRPTEGRIRVRGRIAPLISLGVGFHPEMSGRENIIVNGMLLGLSAAEVAERFDQIVDFAELEEFIDTPVKFYSSGMAMRLGFSVVIHVDPTILLVDEILAVGDASFQLKCFDRLRRFREDGAAIVVVSHSLHQIRQLCPRAVLIQRGKLIHDGDVERAIALHFESASESTQSDYRGMSVEVVERQLIGGHGQDHHANYDDALEIRARLRFHCTIDKASAALVAKTDGGLHATTATVMLNRPEGYHRGDEITVRVAFRARLGGGSYRLSIEIRSPDGQLLGGFDDLILFVAGRPGSSGLVDPWAIFEVDGIDRTDRRQSLLGA